MSKQEKQQKKSLNSVADSISAWTDGIDKIFEEKREQDNLLSPSRPQVKYIKDYTKGIAERGHNIELFSNLFHNDLITKDTAQRLIDNQLAWLRRDIENLQGYIQLEEQDQQED
jgi:hypothetical protein